MTKVTIYTKQTVNSGNCETGKNGLTKLSTMNYKGFTLLHFWTSLVFLCRSRFKF